MLHNSYERANMTFEKAVKMLQDNLQFLANSGKVSDKFIALQNKIIKALIDYQHRTEAIINELQWENTKLAKQKVSEIERLKDVQLMLEAICIIHGIFNFPLWAAKGKDYLINHAVELYNSQTITLGDALMERLEQMDEKDKQAVMRVLSNDARNEPSTSIKNSTK